MARRRRTLPADAPYPPGWEPFLAAINADLDDDTVRLVFADWLQENGDEARAEFIRIQCATARGVGDADAERGLLAEHQARWLIGLPKSVRENHGRFGFRRGFVAALEVCGRDLASTSAVDKDWAANGKAIRRIAALEELHIEQAWNTLMESESLRCLRGLSLSSAGSALIESLAESPALPSLTALTIIAKSSDGVSQRSFRRLFANPQLARLRRLRVASMRLGNLVAGCLGALHFADLEELRLWHLSIGVTGVEALARAREAARAWAAQQSDRGRRTFAPAGRTGAAKPGGTRPGTLRPHAGVGPPPRRLGGAAVGAETQPAG